MSVDLDLAPVGGANVGGIPMLVGVNNHLSSSHSFKTLLEGEQTPDSRCLKLVYSQ